jgi:hypothetical protein
VSIEHEPIENRPPRVLAAIPSLSGKVTRLEALADSLTSAGMHPMIAATGRLLDLRLADSLVPHTSPKSNAGFGETIAHIANSSGDWDWLAIVNDDISVNAQQLRQSLADIVSRDPQERVLAYMDPVRPKDMPTLVSTLSAISLVGPALNRLRRTKSDYGSRTDPQRYFRPFSFAVISRGLWDALNGMDPRMIYTFEDADFGRRAAIASADVLFVENTGVIHAAYSTSRQHVRQVLPVETWSAAAYLEKWTVPGPLVRFLCCCALIIRLPLVPLVDLPRSQHLRGISRAFVALVTQRKPALPDYEAN